MTSSNTVDSATLNKMRWIKKTTLILLYFSIIFGTFKFICLVVLITNGDVC